MQNHLYSSTNTSNNTSNRYQQHIKNISKENGAIAPTLNLL